MGTQTQLDMESNQKLPSPMDQIKENYLEKNTFEWSQNNDYLSQQQHEQNINKNERDLFAGGSFAEFESKTFDQKTKKKKKRTRIVTTSMTQRFSAEKTEKTVGRKVAHFERKKQHKQSWDERDREIAAHRVSLYRQYRHG